MMATTSYAQPSNANPYSLDQVTAGPSPPQSYLYGQGPYSNPMTHTPPSTYISPANFHSHLHVRQLREQRKPLYTPAALRPTELSKGAKEIPQRPQAPLTPPQSKDNSFDSGKSQSGFSAVRGLSIDGELQAADIDMLRRGLSRAASEGLDEDLGAVTGPPTEAHWKPDEACTSCAICRAPFSWYFRRHHCRRCGDVVCFLHLTGVVPLDQNARYHPDGHPSKACAHCLQDWQVIKKLRHSRASSITESQTGSQCTAKAPVPIPQPPRQDHEMAVGSMARSEGMQWSTF